MEPNALRLGFAHTLRRACALFALVLMSGFGTAVAAASTEVEANLEAMERSKWAMPPPMIFAMCADEFLSVEYGFDAVPKTRRVNLAFSRAQEFPPMPEGMEPPRFELADFKFIHASADSVIVSYHVKSLSFPFDAYATSVWAKRQGKWMTVFYQATLTSPDSPGLNDFLP